jgi:hypothetical protein
MKSLLTIALLFFASASYSQQLKQVTFAYDGNLAYFTLATDQNILIRISQDGQLLEFGSEEMSLRNANYYNPKLQPYMGRVEMYGDGSDPALQGKVRYIGATPVNWYAQYEVAEKVGRLKMIGRMAIDYYDHFADKNLQGKMKSIGNLELTYYASIADNEAFKGKLKSIGNNYITYYSSFDDRQVSGKLKSIGSLNYSWYTSFDLNRGGLKTGAYRSVLNGVMYIIQ